MKIVKGEPRHPYSVKDAQYGFLDLVFCRLERERPNFNRRMFDEDFARMFHYSNRHSGALFDINTSNQELTERLLANVDTQYGPHAAQETIREWVEEIAQSLVWSGKAYYYLWDEQESDGIRISAFGPSGVTTLLSAAFQWVPRHTERNWDRDDEERPREVRFLGSAKSPSLQHAQNAAPNSSRAEPDSGIAR